MDYEIARRQIDRPTATAAGTEAAAAAAERAVSFYLAIDGERRADRQYDLTAARSADRAIGASAAAA